MTWLKGAGRREASLGHTKHIAAAPADDGTRAKWLERLWEAYQEDDIPYLGSLGDYWGELCASPEVASHWADELIGTCKMAWSPDPELRGYFKGTTNCLSALLAAGRHEELLKLLDMAPCKMWHYRQYGVKALDVDACAKQYVVAMYMTSSPKNRACAVCSAIEDVQGVGYFFEPLRELERVAVEPLPDFDDFLVQWRALVEERAGAAGKSDRDRREDRWLREVVARTQGPDGLAEVARRSRRSDDRGGRLRPSVGFAAGSEAARPRKSFRIWLKRDRWRVDPERVSER